MPGKRHIAYLKAWLDLPFQVVLLTFNRLQSFSPLKERCYNSNRPSRDRAQGSQLCAWKVVSHQAPLHAVSDLRRGCPATPTVALYTCQPRHLHQGSSQCPSPLQELDLGQRRCFQYSRHHPLRALKGKTTEAASLSSPASPQHCKEGPKPF